MNKMPLGEHIRRYVLFFISVLLQGAGIASITVAHIGTTPISSPNFVISLHTPLTLGDITMLFNILLLILQIMIIGALVKPSHADPCNYHLLVDDRFCYGLY